jgi:hypothetical protein
MKKEVFNYFVIVALAVSATFTSCEKDNKDIEEDSTMQFTTAKSGIVSFTVAGIGIASIDWGDGWESTVTLVPLEFYICGHDYSSDVSRTITVTGKNITHFEFNFEQLTSVDASENTKLRCLDVASNKITSLDVSENINLEIIHCGWNALSSTALDNLFKTLHNNKGPKQIIIGGNPGTNSCNRSIATNKGWTVSITSSD